MQVVPAGQGTAPHPAHSDPGMHEDPCGHWSPNVPQFALLVRSIPWQIPAPQKPSPPSGSRQGASIGACVQLSSVQTSSSQTAFVPQLGRLPPELLEASVLEPALVLVESPPVDELAPDATLAVPPEEPPVVVSPEVAADSEVPVLVPPSPAGETLPQLQAETPESITMTATHPVGARYPPPKALRSKLTANPTVQVYTREMWGNVVTDVSDSDCEAFGCQRSSWCQSIKRWRSLSDRGAGFPST